VADVAAEPESEVIPGAEVVSRVIAEEQHGHYFVGIAGPQRALVVGGDDGAEGLAAVSLVMTGPYHYAAVWNGPPCARAAVTVGVEREESLTLIPLHFGTIPSDR